MATPERVAERVDSLIRSIRGGLGGEIAEHNAAVTVGYIKQVHNLGIITDAQFDALLAAVNEAADAGCPKVNETNPVTRSLMALIGPFADVGLTQHCSGKTCMGPRTLGRYFTKQLSRWADDQTMDGGNALPDSKTERGERRNELECARL